VSEVKKFYSCPKCYKHIAGDLSVYCLEHSSDMSSEMHYIVGAVAKGKEGSAGDQGGYVREVVTYMVVDNLVVPAYVYYLLHCYA
ncbi:unnamed protein product, partial [Ilex paraguariensis]